MFGTVKISTQAQPRSKSMSKISTLAMFPGQGSQFVGMGKSLLDDFPVAKAVFEEAEDTIHVPIRNLCFEGPEEDLKLTANTQPCILTVSVAYWQVFKKETGCQPLLFAGHSLGEYSALVASEKLAFSRAIYLVRHRGEAMQKAVPQGTGSMAAIMGAGVEALETLCKSLTQPGHVVELVNYNSPQQLVVAGHKQPVEALIKVLEKDNMRSVLLPVSAPFHSSLMKPARESMTSLLNETKLISNDTKVIPNISGAVAHPYEISNLIRQIDGPVYWMQSLQAATQYGCDTLIEVGPSKVLFGLARRVVSKDIKMHHTEDFKKTIQIFQS